MDRKLFNMEIDLDDEFDGVQIMSFVSDPAVQKAFIKLNKEKVKLSFSDEKRLVTGVALRTNFPIYRNQDGKEFYFQLSEPEVFKVMCKFMKERRTANVNLEHATDVKGVYLVESFILSPVHQITYPEFKDIEKGSWMVTYKIENDSVWEAIKSGEFTGFSVELLGSLKEPEYYNDKREIVNMLNLIKM